MPGITFNFELDSKPTKNGIDQQKPSTPNGLKHSKMNLIKLKTSIRIKNLLDKEI